MGNQSLEIFVGIAVLNLIINLQQGGMMPDLRKSLVIMGLALLTIAVASRVPQLRALAFGA
jgi:hypothetical protein